MAKILIVEDDKDLNRAYQLILERAGHKVETVFDGEEALSILQDFTPHIILLDLLMPIKSGVEFLREFKRHHKRLQTKILVFTNFDKGPEINEALKLGADMVVIKAWTAPQGMIKVIDNALKKELIRQAVAA